MDTCKQKIGFLSLKSCEKSAVAHCDLCGRPICKEHLHDFNLNGQKHTLCEECYLGKIDEEEAKQNGLYESYNRRRFYRSYGYYYDDYYYHDHIFGHEDYRAFDDHDESTLDETEPLDQEIFQDS